MRANKNMKILVVCQYYYPEPFRISDICESLVNRGHSVTVLTGLPNYPEGRVLDNYRQGRKRNEIINGVKVLRTFEIGRGNSSLRLFLNYISFAISASSKALLMKEKFDVVLVNQLSPVLMGIPAMIYRKKHHKKILLYCLDLWPDSLAAGGISESSIIYKIFLNLSRWIYNSADEILVTSNMFKEYFRETLSLNDKIIKHLPQYAEDLFAGSTCISQSDKYNFVFAGNVGDMQSVDTIVRAAYELRDHREIIFHIVGDGSKLDYCKKLSAELELENIIFYGRRPVSEMPGFYGMANAMLITLKDNKALSYTLPGKVQSYMAAGKPIIGSINGETKRVIEESKCGFCCVAEDYKGLAQLILEFINVASKDEIANNSLGYYKENFSKERFMSVLEESLMKLGGIGDV